MLLSLLEKLEPMNILQIVKQFSDHTFDLPFKYLNDKFYIFSRDSHLEAFCFPFVLLVEWQLKNDISSEQRETSETQKNTLLRGIRVMGKKKISFYSFSVEFYIQLSI